MTDEEKQRIIAKYRKILALTNSPVEGERVAAYHMAEEYRKRWNIQEKKQRNLEGHWEYSNVSWINDYGQREWLYKTWVEPKYAEFFTSETAKQEIRNYDRQYEEDYIAAMKELQESGVGLDPEY